MGLKSNDRLLKLSLMHFNCVRTCQLKNEFILLNSNRDEIEYPHTAIIDATSFSG
jgi:hypothetical protein